MLIKVRSLKNLLLELEKNICAWIEGRLFGIVHIQTLDYNIRVNKL